MVLPCLVVRVAAPTARRTSGRTGDTPTGQAAGMRLEIPVLLGWNDANDRDLMALFASDARTRPRGHTDGGECSKAYQ